ncbi:MAG: hypothetical protein HQL51_15780, partial [Magnetococcales bacterium]|nr:hypothetical protein [Magnetococcales bacterium]
MIVRKAANFRTMAMLDMSLAESRVRFRIMPSLGQPDFSRTNLCGQGQGDFRGDPPKIHRTILEADELSLGTLNVARLALGDEAGRAG